MLFRRFLALASVVLVATTPGWGAPKGEHQFRETPLMAEETRLVLQLLDQVHYLNTSVDRSSLDRLIQQYMSDLDDQRLFFLAEDEQRFQAQFGPDLTKTLSEKGNLDAAFTIFAVYHERAAARAAWIAEELKKDFDFTTDETYAFSRREAPWPASIEDADRLWRLRLKFDLIPDLLNGKTVEQAKETVQKRYERLVKNLGEIESEGVQEIFLTTLTRMYDPHSTFFSAETAEDFNISMRLSLVGIGALLASEDGYCVVKELIPGGPAMLSKELKPDDKIVAVGQGQSEPVDVIGMNLRKVVNMIRGEQGTRITLTIVPHDSTDNAVRREVTLVRDVVQLNANRAKASIHEVPVSESTTVPIGVIEVPSFYGPMNDEDPTSVTADVEELLEKLKTAGVRGIVLDLRRNGGGLLSEAVDMTGLFITQGPVVQVRDQMGQITWKRDRDPKVAYGGPLMVLTSRYSASASEILAGALQNYGRAIIIGDSSTHGKGTVQAVLPTSSFIERGKLNGAPTGAAKLTVQKFYLPNGSSTQNKGVIPDVSLPAIEDYLKIGEADLPNSLPWDEIRAMRIDGRPVDGELREHLKTLALNRVEKLDEFDYLKKRIAWLREREEMKEISLNMEKRRAMKEQEEQFRTAMKERQASLSPLNYPHREIVLDSVARTGNGAPTLEELTETDEEKAEAAFDVHLRESLRVLRDAIQVAPNPQQWTQKIPTVALNAAPVIEEPTAAVPSAAARN